MSSLMTFFSIFRGAFRRSVFIWAACSAKSFTRVGLRFFFSVRGRVTIRLSGLRCWVSFGLGLSRFSFFNGLRCCRWGILFHGLFGLWLGCSWLLVVARSSGKSCLRPWLSWAARPFSCLNSCRFSSFLWRSVEIIFSSMKVSVMSWSGAKASPSCSNRWSIMKVCAGICP